MGKTTFKSIAKKTYETLDSKTTGQSGKNSFAEIAKRTNAQLTALDTTVYAAKTKTTQKTAHAKSNTLSSGRQAQVRDSHQKTAEKNRTMTDAGTQNSPRIRSVGSGMAAASAVNAELKTTKERYDAAQKEYTDAMGTAGYIGDAAERQAAMDRASAFFQQAKAAYQNARDAAYVQNQSRIKAALEAGVHTPDTASGTRIRSVGSGVAAQSAQNAAQRMIDRQYDDKVQKGMQTIKNRIAEAEYWNSHQSGNDYNAYLLSRKNDTYSDVRELVNEVYRSYTGDGAAAKADTGSMQASPYAYLTEEQKETILALAGEERWEDIKTYYSAISRDLNAQYRADLNQYQQDFANQHKILGAAQNIASAYTQPVAYADNMINTIRGEITGEYIPTDYNSFAYGGAHLAQNTAEGLTRDMSEAGKAMTNIGLSIGQNVAMMPLGGGALPMMTASAAGGSTLEALESGATNEQAALYSTLSGAIEAATEKIPLDEAFKILDNPVTRKGLLQNIVKQGAAEAPGESLSELLEYAAGNAVLGEKSDYNQYKKSLMEQGYSEGEAEKETKKLLAKNMAMAAIGGFAGGSLVGGGLSAVSYEMNGAKQQAADKFSAEVRNAATVNTYHRLNEQKNTTAENSGERYALKRDTDGDQFVDVTEDILTGVEKTDVPQVLSDIVKTKFQSWINANGQRIGINQKTAKEWQWSKNADSLRKTNPDAYQDKLRAFNNADELLQASKDYINRSRSHLRKDNFEEFAKGKVKFRIGDNGYSATVVVGITKSKAAVLYDIINLNPIKIVEAPAYTATTATQSVNNRMPDASIKNSKPQKGFTVNGQYMQNNTENTSGLAAAAKSLGESGGKALLAAYDGSQDAAAYYAGFIAYYNAGMAGTKQSKINNRLGQKLSRAQKYAAWTAGQNDAAASLAREKAAKDFAKTAEDSGLVFDSYVEKTLDEKKARLLNDTAKRLGVRVRFVDRVRGGTANAQYNGDEILIEKNNTQPVEFLYGHEITHRMQELAPEEYRALLNTVREMLEEKAEYQMELAQLHGERISYEEAMDEALADYVGSLLSNEKALDKFLDANKDNQTMLQKFLEALRRLIEKLTGAEKRRLQSVEGRVLAALQAAEQQVWKIQGKGSSGSEGVNGARHSLKLSMEDKQAIQSIGSKSVNDFNSVDIAVTERFARIYWNEMGEKSPFFRAWFGDWREGDKTPVQVATQRGDTRGVLVNEDTGWSIQVSGKVFNETKAHTAPQNIAARPYLPYINDIVKKAILLDSYALGIGKEKSVNSLMMHSLYAVADIGNGPEILKLYVEEMNNPNQEDTAKRTYQLQNIENQQIGAKGSGVSPSPVIRTADIKNISDLFKAVKYMDKKFHPKSGSKVVNKDGTPKVVYHGTADRITEFEKGMQGQFTNAEDAKLGFFFSSSRRIAEGYAKNTYPREILRLMREFDENEKRYGESEEADRAYYQTRDAYERAIMAYKNSGKRGEIVDAYLSIRNPLIVDYAGHSYRNDIGRYAEYIRQAMKEGRDGVIFRNTYDGFYKAWDEASDIYVTFEPEQIKSATDNVGIFDSQNPKIRYSLKGINEHGIEVYETSTRIKNMSWQERKKEFIRVMSEDYYGRTAKFTANGQTYYARFDDGDIRKNIYGDKKSSASVQRAKIRAGADGDIFELVENAMYRGNRIETGKPTKAHRGVTDWDYYVKTVQIDGKVYDLMANIRKKGDGEYVYSIQLNEKNSTSASLAPAYNGEKRRMATHKDGKPSSATTSIRRIEEKSNGKILDDRYNLKGEDHSGTMMTEEETQALLQYKSSESYRVNAKLRDGEILTKAEQGIAEALDSALEKLPRVEGTVYRRLVFDDRDSFDRFMTEHAKGQFVGYGAYTSASIKTDGYPVEGNYTVQLVIKGQKARDMAGYGNNFEHEVIFARNSRFYVDRVTYDENGSPVIEMEEAAANDERDNGQLYSEERNQRLQQMQTHQQESFQRKDYMQGVSAGNTGGSAIQQGKPQGSISGRQWDTVRGGGKNSLKVTPEILQEMINRNGSRTLDVIRHMTPAEIAGIPLDKVTTTPALSQLKGDSGTKGSKFYKSTQKSDNVMEETRALIQTMDDVKYYANISNTETLEAANEQLNLGGADEVIRWYTQDAQEATALDVAEGFILLKRYQDVGDYENAAKVVQKLRQIGSRAGQTVQAFSILGRMTPEGMAVYAQKELDQAKHELQKKYGEIWIEERKAMFELTEEETAFIQNRMETAARLPDGRDKNILLAEIASTIEAKLPTTKLRMIKGFARNAMLLNPKTMIRNVVGNAIMNPVYMVQDFVGAGIDKAASVQTGLRTTGTYKVNRENARAFQKGLFESYDDFRRHINTRQVSGDRFDIGEGATFRRYTQGELAKAKKVRQAEMRLSNALNSIDRLTNFLLDAGDRPFFEMHFTNALNNQLGLNKTLEPTAEMVEIATNTALQRTWQDDNGYTKFVNQIRNGLNFGKEFGMGSIVVPFTKTPANLTKALVEYSPVGLVRAISIDAAKFRKSVKHGKADAKMQKQFVDSLSKGIAGTLITALAAALAHADLISGGSDDDKDVANFQKNVLGIAPYSVTVHGKSYAYDWAQPIGGMFAITADFIQNLKNGNEPMVTGSDALGAFGNSIFNALSAGGNVLFEQSFMQGVSALFQEDQLMQGIINAALGLPSQLTPTVLSQIAQIADPVTRTSFYYGKPMKTAVSKAAVKLPGLRNTFAPVVDVMGDEVMNYGGDNSLFNIFLNPANTYRENARVEAKEIQRVYEETGDKTIYPHTAPYYLMLDNEKYAFDPYEMAQYQQTCGKTNTKIIGDLLSSDTYAALEPGEQAAVLAKAATYAEYCAKTEYFHNKEIPFEGSDEMLKIYEAEQAGVPAALYLVAKNAVSKAESIKDADGETIPNSKSLQVMQAVYGISGLTERQRNYLFEDFNVGSKVIHFNKAAVSEALRKMGA